MSNQMMPGNPRYQPKSLEAFFGHDNQMRYCVEVELAALSVLGERGVISPEDMALLTPEVVEGLYAITTTEVDKVEREVTKHDIRALVQIMQARMPAPLRRRVHVPLTSYDVLDTARALQYSRSYAQVVKPLVHQLINDLKDQAMSHARRVQIGRTHGQHALPVTVGFWFATILSRVLANAIEMDRHAKSLVGKISGAVGAYNAQIAFGLSSHGTASFEMDVLKKLGLRPAAISTQILPPEPLAYYLHACVLMSAAIGQFGRDARNLMRSEIGELAEPFAKGQVGSSTMAHKRNPVTFEGLEGGWLKCKKEYQGIFDTIISDHQRDLVGSSPARDFPAMVVILVHQLETLLRPDKWKVSFLSRIRVDEARCTQNFQMQGDLILGEPLYLALQMYGYEGDAHELINQRAVPMVTDKKASSLIQAIDELAASDPQLADAWQRVPETMKSAFAEPKRYIGLAVEKTRQVCASASFYLAEDEHN